MIIKWVDRLDRPNKTHSEYVENIYSWNVVLRGSGNVFKLYYFISIKGKIGPRNHHPTTVYVKITEQHVV